MTTALSAKPIEILDGMDSAQNEVVEHVSIADFWSTDDVIVDRSVIKAGLNLNNHSEIVA